MTGHTGPGRLVLALMLTVLATAPALAAPAEAGSPRPLAPATNADVLRGTFVQHKYLAELDQPLVSRGRYVVARGLGLLWQVDEPVHSSLVITPDALTERNDNRQTSRITTEQQPALGAVASILLAVFQGNTSQLATYFDIQHDSSGDPTDRLVLTPKTDAVSSFIRQLTITGVDTVRRIRIDQPGGDYSVIDLDPSRAAAHPLTPTERSAFSH